MAVVVDDEQGVVGGEAAEVLEPGLEALDGAVHGDEELVHGVAVALERVAQPRRLLLERDVVGRRRRRVLLGAQVVERPRQDQRVHLVVLRLRPDRRTLVVATRRRHRRRRVSLVLA